MSSEQSTEFITLKTVDQAPKSDVQSHVLDASRTLTDLGAKQKKAKRKDVNLGDVEKLDGLFDKLMNEEEDDLRNAVVSKLGVRSPRFQNCCRQFRKKNAKLL